MAAAVEWKTNDGGRIKVRDIIALCWIGLSKMELPGGLRVNPNQIYRNKAVCVAVFNKLLGSMTRSQRPPKAVTPSSSTTKPVRSAMQIAGVFPELYDMLYDETPLTPTMMRWQLREDFCRSGFTIPKKAAEQNPKFLRAQPTTPFFQHQVKYTCPDGFIVPLLYGLRALLEVDKDGLLAWKTNPQAFLSKRLVEIMKSYRLVIEMAGWDPQKVGKNISAYDYAESTVANAYSVNYASAPA